MPNPDAWESWTRATGPFENDPNVTDKKFPGNPTRSYRSSAPLRVVREVTTGRG